MVGGHRIHSRQGLSIFCILCPTLVSLWSIDLSQAISGFFFTILLFRVRRWSGFHLAYAFIFSLRNKEGLGPFKSMAIRPSYAIYRDSTTGPIFGSEHNIYIVNKTNSNTNSHSDLGVHNYYRLFQAKYKTSTQSWLGLVTSHLMRWRCFTLAESQDVTIEFYLLRVRHSIYNFFHEVKCGISKKSWLGKCV